MKFFLAFALLFAVASARGLPAAVVANTDPEIQEIVAAIQSPSTDPATAVALEEMLLQLLGMDKPETVEVGPALVDQYEPISIGPALVDFPVPDGGAVTEVQPSPVKPSPSPLVQIIVNVNSNVAGNPVVVEPVKPVKPVKPPAPTPVQVVDAPEAPEQVVVVDKPIVAPEPAEIPEAPESVIIAEPIIAPEPAETPEAPESVVVAEPIIVAPAIVLPEILN